MTGNAPHNEKALLSQVAKGDEKAFRVLFDAYRDRLYFYTLRICSSSQVAEDVVQDTFLKIWLRRELLGEIENFDGYIFRMAQNGVLTGLRRKATEDAVLHGGTVQDPGIIDPDQALHVREVRRVLQGAVKNLPEQQQKVYRLRREEELRIADIARALGISEVTVKRHLTEAQKTLRKALKDAFPPDAAILVIIFCLSTL